MRRTTAFILMAAAAVAFMAPALFTGRTFGATDLLMTHSPYRESFATEPPVGNPLQSDITQQLSFVAEFWSAAREGRLQLWEPDVGGGIPMFTGMYNQLLPPWFFVFLVVPLALGTTLGMTLALFVGQVGVYGLARRLGLSVSGATLAGVAYAFSGSVTAMLLRIHGALLFPLLLFAIHGAITEPKRRGRYLALTSIVMVFVWSSGFPFAGVSIIYVAVGWIAYLAVAHSKGRGSVVRRLTAIFRSGAPAAAALVAGTMIASIQLLPSAEFLAETGFLDRTYSTSAHIDIAHLATGVSGRFFGAYQDDDWWWPEAGGSNPFEASFTIGLVTLGLLAVPVAGMRGRRDTDGDRTLTRFLMPVSLIVLAGVYVGGFALGALHVLPFTINNPIGRARFIAALPIALAAGSGLDTLVTRSREGNRSSLLLRVQVIVLLGAVAVGTFFAARRAIRLDHAGDVARDLAVPAAAVVASAVAFVVLRKKRAVAALIVVAAAAAELQWGAWGFVPASDRDAFYPWNPAFDTIAADVGPGGPYRFLSRDRNTPRLDVASVLDLKDARTAFPRMERYQDFWVALDPDVFRLNRYAPTFQDLDPSSPVLDALAVRYLVEPLHRNALEATSASVIKRRDAKPLPARFRVPVPRRGIRSLVIPLRASQKSCLTGWVELRAGRVTVRRLLREVDGVQAFFVLPDVGVAGSDLAVELTSTSCPVLLDAGSVGVRTRRPDSVLSVVSTKGWIVYERASAIPRASLAGSTIEIADPVERVRFISERRSGSAVTVEDGFGSRRLQGGTAELVVDEPDRVVVRANSRGPGLLVLRDVAAPGWAALVDGRPAGIITADHAFRSVEVPTGRSVVEFRYDPPTYRTGRWLALGGLLLTIALAMGSRMARSMTRRKPPATVEPPDPGWTDDSR